MAAGRSTRVAAELHRPKRAGEGSFLVVDAALPVARGQPGKSHRVGRLLARLHIHRQAVSEEDEIALSLAIGNGERLNATGLRLWLDRRPPPGSWRDFFEDERPVIEKTEVDLKALKQETNDA